MPLSLLKSDTTLNSTVEELYPGLPTNPLPVGAQPLIACLKHYGLHCVPNPRLPQRWEALSLLAISFSWELLRSSCAKDLEETALLMEAIVQDDTLGWSPGYKALCLHSLLAHVVAYRLPDYFLEADRFVWLPTLVGANWTFKQHRLRRKLTYLAVLD